MNTPFKPATPKHYLFMLPQTTTLEEQREVVATARQLLADSYVYVASAHERTMEDRDNIRFMPLRTNDLPCFAEVAGVMVARDAHLARVAKQVYAGAPVMVFDPAESSPIEAEAEAVVRNHTVAPRRKPRSRTREELRQAA